MPRSVQDANATASQRDALRHFAGRLGLDVEDLEAPDDPAKVWVGLSREEYQGLRAKASTLGTSTAVLIRGLIRGHLRVTQ